MEKTQFEESLMWMKGAKLIFILATILILNFNLLIMIININWFELAIYI